MIRSLNALQGYRLRAADGAVVGIKGHGEAMANLDFVLGVGYMLTVVDRGADILHGDGRIGEELRDALKAEARRRSWWDRSPLSEACSSSHSSR